MCYFRHTVCNGHAAIINAVHIVITLSQTLASGNKMHAEMYEMCRSGCTLPAKCKLLVYLRMCCMAQQRCSKGCTFWPLNLMLTPISAYRNLIRNIYLFCLGLSKESVQV
jgi:hypothetical protein